MNTSKRAIYYQQAEDLYVKQGFTLQVIEDLFDKKVTRRTIQNWKTEFGWDNKRKKFLETTQSLIDETKELVKITLDKAKLDPSSKNIAAYERALSALNRLEQHKAFELPEDDGKEKVLTPERIEQIKKEIGLI